MSCALCAKRRPRRYCPGVRGDICTTCCGIEREVTVPCPLDCEYLIEARKHEKSGIENYDDLPNRDIRVTEEWAAANEELLSAVARSLADTALRTEATVDSDAREALAALIRTYRTLATGLVYESRPENPLAAKLFDAVQRDAAAFRQHQTETLGMPKTRDADVLVALVFFQHLELDRNNGRQRSRAFLSALREFYADAPAADPDTPSPLLLS